MSFYASNDRILVTDTNGTPVFDTNTDIPHILGVYEANISKVFYEQYYTEEYFRLGSLPSDIDFVISRATCTPFNLEGILYDDANPAGAGATGGAQGYSAWERPAYSGLGDPEYFDWANNVGAGQAFFQGSLPLEMGQTMLWQNGGYTVGQYARRVMHVYPEPAWDNQLVVMFQQGVKSGYGGIPTTVEQGDMISYGPSGSTQAQRRYGEYNTNGFDQYFDAQWPNTRYGQPMPWVQSGNHYVPSGKTFGRGAVRWEINLKVWAGRFRVGS